MAHTKFRISRHALEEMEHRGIPRDLAEAVLEAPQQIVTDPGGNRVRQSQLEFGDGKMYLLRVIAAEETDPPTVVPVYRTSKIEKYWRSE